MKKTALLLLLVFAFANCSTKSNPVIGSPDGNDQPDQAKIAALQDLQRKLTEHIWIAGSGIEENIQTGEKSMLYYFKAVYLEFASDNTYYNDSRGHGRWEVDVQTETVRLLNPNTGALEAKGTISDNVLTITWKQSQTTNIIEEYGSN